MTFDAADALERLDQLNDAALDELSFGVVRLGPDAKVVAYNRCESERAGLRPAHAIGRHFFEQVAPCTNNFMVAQRFVNEPELDATLPYVFTFRMKPGPVVLRLLRSARGKWSYVLIDRREA